MKHMSWRAVTLFLAIAPIIMTALRFLYGRNVCESGFRVAMNCHKICLWILWLLDHVWSWTCPRASFAGSRSGFSLGFESFHFEFWVKCQYAWYWPGQPWTTRQAWKCVTQQFHYKIPWGVKYCLVGLDSSCCNPRTRPRGSWCKTQSRKHVQVVVSKWGGCGARRRRTYKTENGESS